MDPRVRRTLADVSRAAADLLVEQGWDQVTHARVAEAAGYARATVYKHWPTQHELLRVAFSQMGSVPHGENTGTLRGDLVSELEAFRFVLVESRFARAIAALAERAAVSPEVAAVRDDFLGGGQQLLCRRLDEAFARRGSKTGARVAADMLSGALVWRVVMMGDFVEPEYVERLVDVALGGIA